MLRNPTQIPRSTIFEHLSKRKTETRREKRECGWIDGRGERQGSTDRFGVLDKRGRGCIFISSVLVHGRTDNEQMAGYAVRARLPPELASECFAANADFANHLSIEAWLPWLLGRGDTLIDHHLLSSLYPLFFSRFFSPLCSPISMRLSIHPSIHPPFFPLQSIGRVSRLKRHLLILATFHPFFSSLPFFFSHFPFRVYVYTYIRMCVNVHAVPIGN